LIAIFQILSVLIFSAKAKLGTPFFNNDVLFAMSKYLITFKRKLQSTTNLNVAATSMETLFRSVHENYGD